MSKEEEDEAAAATATATATATAMRLRNNLSSFMKILSSSNSNILLAALVFLLLVVIFVLLLHFYARFFWSPTSRSRRRRTLTTPTRIIPSAFLGGFDGSGSNGGGGGSSAVADKGLESSVISSIPLFVYEDERDEEEEEEEEEEECVICLGFWDVGEIGRKLRNCGHGFHVECIDMWLSFHSTCPLCRSSVLASVEDNLKPAIDDINGDQEEEEDVRVQVICDGEEDNIASGNRREDDLKTGVNGNDDGNINGVSEVRLEIKVEESGGEGSRRERSMSCGGSSSLKRMLSSTSR